MKEVLGHKVYEILYAHESVDSSSDAQTEEMRTKLSHQGLLLFSQEIQKIQGVLEVLIEYELFVACSQVVTELDVRLKRICIDSTEKDCCVELNSTRQWMNALLLCFGCFE